MLVRYQALPDDMKVALEPRLLPAQMSGELAPVGEASTGSHGFRLEPAPGSRYEPGDAQDSSAVPDAAPAGGQRMAPPTEPPPGGPDYQAADAEARRIASVPEGQPSAPRGTSLAGAAAPAAAPAGGVLGEIGQAASQSARGIGSWLGRAASASAGAVTDAIPLTLIPTNTQAELHPLGEGLRVRTAPGQHSATVQRRVDDGLLGRASAQSGSTCRSRPNGRPAGRTASASSRSTGRASNRSSDAMPPTLPSVAAVSRWPAMKLLQATKKMISLPTHQPGVEAAQSKCPQGPIDRLRLAAAFTLATRWIGCRGEAFHRPLLKTRSRTVNRHQATPPTQKSTKETELLS